MKVLKCFLFGAAVLGVCVLMHFYGEATAAKEMQEDIAKEVIRLHVVANSDLEMDQKLKLEVKEEIVKMLRKKMKKSDSVEAAAHVLQAQIPEIEQCAANYIEKKGYDYPVTATLEKFVDQGFVKEFADLFLLDRYKEQIVSMDGFGEKSYENLQAALERAKHTTMARFVYGLGIAGIRRRQCQGTVPCVFR